MQNNQKWTIQFFRLIFDSAKMQFLSYTCWYWSADTLFSQLSIDHNQEGIINLGLGASADIGEWKSNVSGHRDVAFKPAREGLKEGKQNACREKSSRSDFSATVEQIISSTKAKLQMLSYKVSIT